MQSSTSQRIVLSFGPRQQAAVEQAQGPSPDLDEAGGKGASLVRMAAAGLPVPPGFVLTTEAYRQFLAANDLRPVIAEAVHSLPTAEPASWERAATTIQDRFGQAAIPSALAHAVHDAYAVLGAAAADGGGAEVAAAVRSSPTAEDLPGASFAGQQETYLNVRGETALLDAIRRCWASLWTDRALAYRHRLGVDQQTVAMAVVVQH